MSPLARLSVGLALGALVACAPARDSDREAASGALIGGSTAAPDTFPATVALAPVPHGGRPDGGAAPLGRACTAARIGSRHLCSPRIASSRRRAFRPSGSAGTPRSSFTIRRAAGKTSWSTPSSRILRG
ncbi:MAG: hypothetical protein U0235_17030 [Polyangiaceae bacterium]